MLEHNDRFPVTLQLGAYAFPGVDLFNVTYEHYNKRPKRYSAPSLFRV